MGDLDQTIPDSPRKRSRSTVDRASILRKAGSVADIKANQVATNFSVRNIKRTASTVGSETSRESALLAEQEVDKQAPNFKRRSSRHKSLRTGAVDRNDTYDELYQANKLIKVPGYCLETVLDVPDQDMLDRDYCKEEIEFAEYLDSNFCNREEDVCHFIPPDSSSELMVITVIKDLDGPDTDLAQIKAIITTPEKDEKVIIGKSQMRQSKSGKDTAKQLKSLSDRKLLAYLRPDSAKKKLMKTKSNKALLDGLKTLAHLKLGYLHADKQFKFGVVHWTGQVLEEDILAESEGSKAFNDFLDCLGDRVELLNWSGYAGGLDTTKNKDGKWAVHTNYNESEILFHVSTLLDGTSQQRKVHIGNDSVVIVFKEADEPFSPEYIHSKFNQVFIVVSIEKDEDAIRAVRRKNRGKDTSSPKAPGSPSSRTVASQTVIKSPKKSSRSISQITAEDNGGDTCFPDSPIMSPRYSTGSGEEELDLPRLTRSADQIFEKKHEEVHRTASGGLVKRKNSANQNIFEVKTLDVGKAKKKGTYYRIAIVRRDGVPSFPPQLPFPFPVYKKGRSFREFLLTKAMMAMVASYQSPSFSDRIQTNRKAFLENLRKNLLVGDAM